MNDAVLERAWGSASASSPAEAERLAQMVEDARAVFHGLPFFTDRPLRIHFTDQDLPGHAAGITVTNDSGDGWISVDAQGSNRAHTVAHELAHFHFNTLGAFFPQLVEEGMCELLGARVVAADSVFDYRLATAAVSYLNEFTLIVKSAEGKAWLDYLVRDVPSIESALRLDSESFFGANKRAKDAYYGLGLAIATCIGFDGLCDLARAARGEGLASVAPERILEAAGLQPLSQSKLRLMFGRAMGVDGPVGEDAEIEITLGD